MNWTLLAGSLAGVLLLAGIARLLGLGKAPPLDGEHAVMEAERRLVGFRGVDAVADRQGRAAVVLGVGGDVALVRPHGAHYAVRRMIRPFPWYEHEDRIVIQSGERMFGTLELQLDRHDRDKLLTLL